MSPHRLPLRLLTLAATLAVTTMACSSDNDDMNDDVDQTEVTSVSGSAVPGQDQDPINTDSVDSQVTPTQAP